MLISILTWISLGMSAAAFLVFVFLSMRKGPSSTPSDAARRDGRREGEISDITKLTEATAKLADSFTKAGPALSALVASILYLLVATLGAGLEKFSHH